MKLKTKELTYEFDAWDNNYLLSAYEVKLVTHYPNNTLWVILTQAEAPYQRLFTYAGELHEIDKFLGIIKEVSKSDNILTSQEVIERFSV